VISNDITLEAGVAEYALRLGDDALICAQRLAEWSSRAPDLEDDIALTNIALDLLGQARHLLTIAAEREGSGRTEDDLAFLRSEREFRNVRLVEQPNGDFASTIVRQLLFATYQQVLYTALAASDDDDLAAVAAKARKEVSYHRDHAAIWTVRLGDGTGESRRRMSAALDHLWPFTAELFETDDLTGQLVDAGVAADPAALHASWEPSVAATLTEATLPVPGLGSRRPTGGRRGIHGEELGHLLAEMQWLHRAHPGANW
jgi:ring-1,2-phenylacetyl-CoA epoxidase subunit PaaC